MKTTIYIKVSVEDELPTKEGFYYVVFEDLETGDLENGNNWWRNGKWISDGMNSSNSVTNWLQEVELELPSDEEIEDRWRKMINISKSVGFENGARWMRDLIQKHINKKA